MGTERGMDLSDEVERIRIALGHLVVRLGIGVGPLAPVLPREPLQRYSPAHLAPMLTPPLSHTVMEERGKR